LHWRQEKNAVFFIFWNDFCFINRRSPLIAMPARLPSSRPLPGFIPLLLLGGVLAVSWMITPESRSQAPSAPPALNAEAVENLVTKLKAQQDTLAANQTKIEAETTQLKTQMQQAKIFSARIK
jgi:hypothetical protein